MTITKKQVEFFRSNRVHLLEFSNVKDALVNRG